MDGAPSADERFSFGWATIRIGPLPAPLLHFFHQHLADRGNHQTMNHRTQWLFPGTRAGHHIAEQALMQ